MTSSHSSTPHSRGSAGRPPGGAPERFGLGRAEFAALRRLDRPERIQAFLDATAYSTDPIYRCPRSVLRDRRAHCFDGAVLAALAFAVHGAPPLLLDLRAERDDDHVLAVFCRRGHFGAVAKSNCAPLRFREPVYRSLRELAMSYFDLYFNTDGDKSLRAYSRLVDLRAFDDRAWAVRDEAMDAIAERLDRVRHHPLVSPAMVRELVPVDDRTYRAALLGADPAGRPAGDRLRTAVLGAEVPPP